QDIHPSVNRSDFCRFLFAPCALKMLAVAAAMPVLFALKEKKIKLPKFHLSCPRGVYQQENCIGKILICVCVALKKSFLPG
ncbi:MAG: hypothetical protein KDD10_12265, partial [Phaeodactylibacter sp.]|nr:hypothetical protein [Phaeodactylibacter sp.]